MLSLLSGASSRRDLDVDAVFLVLLDARLRVSRATDSDVPPARWALRSPSRWLDCRCPADGDLRIRTSVLILQTVLTCVASA